METSSTLTRQLAIGVDIGGTRTKLGLVDVQLGKVLEMLVYPTETKNGESFISLIEDAINTFKKIAEKENDEIIGIGFGVPGFVFGGKLVDSTYGFLEFMEDYPLADIVQKRCNISCILDNDARVVALGEAKYGKGKDFSRVLVFTLGTGFGVGFAINGMLDGMAPYGHMAGHIIIGNSEIQCYCGRKGCLEALVSATGIGLAATEINWVNKYPSIVPTPENIFRERQNGNKDAVAVIENFISFLKIGINNYINIYAPDIIVLGGGVAKALKNDLHHFQDKKLLRPFKAYEYEVAVSVLSEHAGILGGAALFTQNEIQFKIMA